MSSDRRRTDESLALGATAVLGVSFWFWLGFPFGHHNESYAWAVELSQSTLAQALTRRLDTVATFRPLAQGVAWLGYRGSGGSLVPAQLWNYLVAIAAWLVLLRTRPARTVFALLALVQGCAFFSGYIYLFHLHGVFYSPLLLLIALLFPLLEGPKGPGSVLAAAVLVVAASLFHPFAWVLGAACLFAFMLDHRRHAGARGLAATLAAAGAMAAMAAWIFGTSGGVGWTVGDRLRGALVSYRMIEVHAGVTATALGLCLFEVSSIARTLSARAVASAGVVAAAAVLLPLGLPATLLWIVLCLLDAVLSRSFGLVALLLATAALPMAAPTGSPTYAVFTLMTCAGVAARGTRSFEDSVRAWVPRWAPALVVLALAVLVSLRCGVPVPLLARLARPVLAESERTHQLETILRWLPTSGYADRALRLDRPASNPAVAGDAVDRVRRAPTSQKYLDEYVAFLRGRAPVDGGDLIVRFGGETCEAGTPALTVEGRTAGAATVCLPRGTRQESSR